MVSAGVLCFSSCGEKDDIDVEFVQTPYEGTTLYVYNWGEYISDGSEGSMDVIRVFEKKYGITVKYDYYSTNEEMYAQLSNNAKYDVIVPSDYMIQRMINENMLQKINTANIPNYHYIDTKYTTAPYYDPTNEYSVPYTVGMVGIVYNKTMVSEVDKNDPATMTWDLLWSDKYTTGQKINLNNPRDAFGVAMVALGLDVNTSNRADWEAAYEKLRAQDCIYLMDEIYNKMENNTSAIAAYYAGDCLQMMRENPDLDFFYPTEGTNIFVDAMCIPKNAENVGAAELFINFMLEPDIATANANFICYASPNTAVPGNADYDYKIGTEYYSYLYEYPDSYLKDDGSIDESVAQYYHILDNDTQLFLNEKWAQLGIDDGEEGSHVGTYIFLGVLAVVLLGGGGYFIIHKMRAGKKTTAKK